MREGQVPRQWLQSKLFFLLKKKQIALNLVLNKSYPVPHLPLPIFSFPFPLLFRDVKVLIATVWKTFLKLGWVPLARASSRPRWIHTWSWSGSFLGILGWGSCKDQQMEWVGELACHWQDNWSSLVPLLWVTGSPLYFLSFFCSPGLWIPSWWQGRSLWERFTEEVNCEGVWLSLGICRMRMKSGKDCWEADRVSRYNSFPRMSPYNVVHLLSCFVVSNSATPWTVAHQAPLSMGFSRQEYWSGLSCPPSGDFPHPGIEPTSLMSPALAGEFLTTGATWEGRGACYKSLSKWVQHHQLPVDCCSLYPNCESLPFEKFCIKRPTHFWQRFWAFW